MPRFVTLDTTAYQDTVTVELDGAPVQVPAGLSVAAVTLLLGLPWTRRTPVSRAPRGPLCMMGVCFDCLIEIDGVPNRQACMVQVAEGMRIRRQQGPRDE